MSDYIGPHRRLRLKLDLEADTLRDLAMAIQNIGWTLEHDKHASETRTITSGGVTSGHHLELTCDPSMTGERYQQLLTEWLAERKASRQ